MAEDVAIKLRNENDEQLVESAAGGMRLSAWLATRTFQFTVHTLDIASVTAIAGTSTADVACLAARIAATIGTGEPVLCALTDRSTLPRASPSCEQPQDHASAERLADLAPGQPSMTGRIGPSFSPCGDRLVVTSSESNWTAELSTAAKRLTCWSRPLLEQSGACANRR